MQSTPNTLDAPAPAGLDLALIRFNALIGATGITSEARAIRNDDSLTDEQALHVILAMRWPNLPERDAHIACARRYDVVLPA